MKAPYSNLMWKYRGPPIFKHAHGVYANSCIKEILHVVTNCFHSDTISAEMLYLLKIIIQSYS